MQDATSSFISAIPALASLDIQRSVDFFCSILGFAKVYAAPNEYGIVRRDAVEIHFWACSEPHIAQNTSCRIQVEGIDVLHAACLAAGVLHPNAPLGKRPWGTIEFGILDPDKNLVTFFQADVNERS